MASSPFFFWPVSHLEKRKLIRRLERKALVINFSDPYILQCTMSKEERRYLLQELMGKQSQASQLIGYMCVCLVIQSGPTLCDPMNPSPPGSPVHGDSAGKNNGVGCHALLQGIFLTQGSNPDLPHCRWILYHLSHQGSRIILEWVVYPFSSGSSLPRNRTRVSCIAGRFFIS